MNTFGKLALGGAAAMTIFSAGAAAQASVLVSDVSIYNWNTVAVTDYGTHVSTGITFNNDFLVFCVDLQHNIGVGHHDPALVYEKAFLTHDGAGNALSEAASNRIGQLAARGRYLVSIHAPDLGNQLSAIQAAIWSIEYSKPVSFSGGLAYLNDDVAQYLTVADNGKGRARALLAHGPGASGTQNMVGGVPEPATWALMLAGFGLAGAGLRSRRRIILGL